MTVPASSEVVVMDNAVPVTVMERLAVAVVAGLPESVTFTVKFDVPAFVGLPEITPALDRDNPVGKVPDEIVHEYGEVPPVAARVAE